MLSAAVRRGPFALPHRDGPCIDAGPERLNEPTREEDVAAVGVRGDLSEPGDSASLPTVRCVPSPPPPPKSMTAVWGRQLGSASAEMTRYQRLRDRFRVDLTKAAVRDLVN